MKKDINVNLDLGIDCAPLIYFHYHKIAIRFIAFTSHSLTVQIREEILELFEAYLFAGLKYIDAHEFLFFSD